MAQQPVRVINLGDYTVHRPRSAARMSCQSSLHVLNLSYPLDLRPEVRMPSQKVPDIVVGRLPLYLRALNQMAGEGKEITSSQELGTHLGISSAQIRKDLSQFGEFGKQGTGYHISFLIEQLQKILKLDRLWDVVLVGAGDLGTAIAHYAGFIDRGFRVKYVYDNDPGKIGHTIGKFTVKDIGTMAADIESDKIKVAMLAVPAGHAQEVSELLVKAGIHAILCYAPTSLNLPDSIQVQYIDPSLHLQHMTYYM
jgi:redox-sensing transcriptional repressor